MSKHQQGKELEELIKRIALLYEKAPIDIRVKVGHKLSGWLKNKGF